MSLDAYRISVCFTHFKTLTLANLDAALYSVRQQDLSRVAEIAVFDNDSSDDWGEIQAVIDRQRFFVPARLLSVKHGDATRAQAWSTNQTVRRASFSWIFYTRSDYLLDASMLTKFIAVIDSKPPDWDGFIVSHGRHLHQNIEQCEAIQWRVHGLHVLPGVDYDYTEVDSGVWMARRETFERVGGFDERLAAWGHAQTEWQYRMHKAGVEFVRIPEVLFYHPQHAAPRDIEVAHQQLRERGLDLHEMWARYHGRSPYA